MNYWMSANESVNEYQWVNDWMPVYDANVKYWMNVEWMSVNKGQ